MTDRLFLVNPDWHDEAGGPWYCPAGAVIEGVLAFYPALTDHLEITRVDVLRPRAAVVELVGEANQSCPLLVLTEGSHWPDARVSEVTGRLFLQDEAMIPYLADRYGIGRPHP